MPHVMCFGATPRPPHHTHTHRSSDRPHIGTLAHWPHRRYTAILSALWLSLGPRAVPPCRAAVPCRACSWNRGTVVPWNGHADQPSQPDCSAADATHHRYIYKDESSVGVPALFFSHITHSSPAHPAPPHPLPRPLRSSTRYQTVPPAVIRHATTTPASRSRRRHYPLPPRLHRVISINGNQ